MDIDRAEAELIWEWINEICMVTTKEEVAERLRAKLALFLKKQQETQ